MGGEIFFHFFDFWDVFFSFFSFSFWVKGRGIFFIVFPMFFGSSDLIWPAPLLAQNQTIFCPNLCVENFGQWGCSSGQFVAHVLFFGPWTTLRWTPFAQDLCGIPRCGVGVSLSCCGVCVQNFRGASKIWALPRLHPPPDRPPPDRPKFRFLFPSPATIFILSSSLGGRVVEFGGGF